MKRSPLTRKVGLKRSTKPLVTRKPMKRVSTKQVAKLRTYAKIRIEKLNEDPMCQRCGAAATQTHHRKGRGIHLDEKEWLMSICLNCHTELHENPNQARKDGWIID